MGAARDANGDTEARAAPGWAPMLLGASVMLGFIALTNRWRDWNASLRLVQANDEIDYRAIATAAPRFPADKLQNQHAQRFAFHYLIGLLGRVFGVDAVYDVATVLTVIAIVIVLMCVLRTLRLSTGAALLCLAVFILNTYSVRYYLIARGEITDLFFDLGLLLSLWGLFAREDRLILAGTLVAAVARQTELPAAVALGIAVWFWPGSAAAPGPRRLGRACAPPLIAAVIYVVEAHVARSFSYDTTPGLSSFTVLGELTALPSGLGTLAQHAVRSGNGLIGAGALLLAGLGGLGARRRWRSLPVEFWGCLGIAVAIAIQALALSASYAEHNETRLSVLALGALVCALAVLLAALETQGRVVGTGRIGAISAVLAFGSFHHLYTIVGTANARQTVVLQVLAALAAGLILGLGLGRRTRMKAARH